MGWVKLELRGFMLKYDVTYECTVLGQSGSSDDAQKTDWNIGQLPKRLQNRHLDLVK